MAVGLEPNGIDTRSSVRIRIELEGWSSLGRHWSARQARCASRLLDVAPFRRVLWSNSRTRLRRDAFSVWFPAVAGDRRIVRLHRDPRRYGLPKGIGRSGTPH